MRLEQETHGAEQRPAPMRDERADRPRALSSTEVRLHDGPAVMARSGSRLSGEDWIARFHQTGDERALAHAVECFLPLARTLARRYTRDPDALEDLVQVASLGLVNAIKRFDPNHGARFSSYAVPTIAGELRRYFRLTGWNLHVVRRVQENVLIVRKAVARCYQEHGRTPRVSDLELLTGLDTEAITEALYADRVQATVSLDKPAAGPDDSQGAPLGELIGAEDTDFQLVDHFASAGPILRMLPEQKRKVLFLRFMHDMTQSEIAEQVGCSQMQVSRILRSTIEQINDQLAPTTVTPRASTARAASIPMPHP